MVADRTRALAKFAVELATYRTDPVGFCRNILGFLPHAGQARWLINSVMDENALTTGNRYGKTDVAAAKRIWKCVFKIGWTAERARLQAEKRGAYQSLNVAPTADQAQLVFHKAFAMLQRGKASWLVKDTKMTPFPTITFVNGAVFQARSTAGDGRHLLGHDYDDVNWDEAAYETRFQQILDNVLRMRLVDRAGKLDFTSTGNGKNAYGELFLSGLSGGNATGHLYSQSGSTRENPHIDQKRVDALAARMSERMRAQNIDGRIVEGGGSFFELADIAACEDALLNEDLVFTLDDDQQHASAEVFVRTEGGVKRSWRDAYPSHRYIHGWDLADKKDFTVGWTLDLSTKPFTVVEFERFHQRGWDYNYSRIRARDRKYGTRKATKIDSTGLGDVVENELKDLDVEGVNFGGGRKDPLLANLQSALSLRDIRMPMLQVAHNELAFYERDDEKLVQDCVMALGVALWFAKRSTEEYAYAVAI